MVCNSVNVNFKVSYMQKCLFCKDKLYVLARLLLYPGRVFFMCVDSVKFLK